MSIEEPMVVVITINYNQDQYTIDCVKSVLKSKYRNFHVILIDNGSEQSIVDNIQRELPQCPELTIAALPDNLGYVGGINYGFDAAAKFNPDFCLIMNNDTLIAPDSITELVRVAEERQRNAIVSGKVYNYDEKDSLQYIGQKVDPEGGLNQVSIVKNKREKDVGQYEQEMEMGMLDDIFWLVPTKIQQDIGSYSEYFFLYGEQNDFALRAVKAGYKLVYTPKAQLWHKGGVSTCDGDKKSPRIDYWSSVATMKLAVLHLDEKQAKAFCFKWPLRKLLKTLVLLVSGKASFEHVKSIVLAKSHFNYWNKIRYKDNGYNPFS